jgi:hypothetical protein
MRIICSPFPKAFTGSERRGRGRPDVIAAGLPCSGYAV